MSTHVIPYLTELNTIQRNMIRGLSVVFVCLFTSYLTGVSWYEEANFFLGLLFPLRLSLCFFFLILYILNWRIPYEFFSLYHALEFPKNIHGPVPRWTWSVLVLSFIDISSCFLREYHRQAQSTIRNTVILLCNIQKILFGVIPLPTRGLLRWDYLSVNNRQPMLVLVVNN